MPTTTPFHEVLATLIEGSPLTQREIAKKLGYSRPNIISMFKQGKAPVPIKQVPALACVLEVDPAWLLRLALRSYHREVLDTIEKTMGPPLSQHEVEIIRELRMMTGDRDPKLTDAGQRLKLGEFAEILMR